MDTLDLLSSTRARLAAASQSSFSRAWREWERTERRKQAERERRELMLVLMRDRERALVLVLERGPQEWQQEWREREQERQEREQDGQDEQDEQERQERERKERQEREAKRLRRHLRKQLTLLKDVITRDVLLTKNSHSLLLAMLLFGLFLELLGWFILIGLFTTVLIYLLLIIHPTFVSVKAGPDVAISKHSTEASPESPFSVWSRKLLALPLCESPNVWQW